MEKKYLIAYGTAAGSTGEVAQAIGEEMRQKGLQVDIRPVEEIRNLDGYAGVVVGSAVRVFHLIGKTRKFLRRNRRQLKTLPVAYFIVCMTMKESTTENMEKAKQFAQPMLDLKEPLSLGLFAGCMDPEKLTGMFAKTMESQPKEDCRDWEAIRSWGQEVASLMSAN